MCCIFLSEVGENKNFKTNVSLSLVPSICILLVGLSGTTVSVEYIYYIAASFGKMGHEVIVVIVVFARLLFFLLDELNLIL